MTDVLKIALDRRVELHKEAARLDEFIRMAETLIRMSQTRQAEQGAVSPVPAVERPASVASKEEPETRSQVGRTEISGMQVSAEVSRPSVIRRGQAAS